MQQTIPQNDGYTESYVGSVPSTGPFAIDFPFFSLNDIVVTTEADGSHNPVVLLRGTDCDITGVATEDGSFSSGTVTLYLAVANTTVRRFRTTPIERLSNFPLQGFFSRLALNAELNKMTVWMQETNALLGSTSEGSQAYAPIASPVFVGDPKAPTPPLGDNDTSIATTAFIQAALVGIGAALPSGTIIDYAGTTAPSAAWLLCQGQTVNRTSYASLFAVIGTTYNVGGETGTEFRLPDLRGRVTAGREITATRLTTGNSGIDGAVLGAVGGGEVVALSTANLAAHSHSINPVDHFHSILYGTGHYATINTGTFWQNFNNVGTGALYYSTNNTPAGHGITGTNNTGSGTVHQNTQPTIVLNKLIKT